MAPQIHLIFKTHLDVGFTGYAAQVVRNYFENYIPAAIRVAREMRETGRPERFIWTTGSWLIYEYLEQASPAQREDMETAIQAGDIAWHALPFTTHTELMDAGLFRVGLSLSQELDRRFGKHTIAAKMTDVPGHTRGIIPLLAEAGVRFLHLGVNACSPLPSVPPLFRWQDPGGEEILVMYESGYGHTFSIPGIQDALAFGHTDDNLGPQSPQQVLDVYRDVQAVFPGGNVFASTLDAFAEKLEPIRSQLPVVTQEIGDTWIHGVGSDPIKVSQFRELLRLRNEWLSRDPALRDDPRFRAFQRRLLLVPEHTWGMDVKTFLGDQTNYRAAEFRSARRQPNFRTMEASWAEKRAYVQLAVDVLDGTSFAVNAHSQLQALRPALPDLTAWSPVREAGQSVETPHFAVQFDPLTGALVSLVSRATNRNWSGEDHPLGWLRYQTFSAADYERYFGQYIPAAEREKSWSRDDFTKPGIEVANPLSRTWQPSVDACYRRSSDTETRFLFHLSAEPPSAVDYGCPKDFYLQYTFDNRLPRIAIDLQWFNKSACRLPEALWFSFQPRVSPDAQWRMEKLGQEISPLEVVENGNRHLHAVGSGVTCNDEGTRVEIVALDSPLVAPGQPSLLNFTNEQPQLLSGMHFNLYNNLWGTNFPMWFEEDCRFRFQLSF
jgi:hypothetical protein